MELNFMLMIHMPWLYQERLPTSNKEKKKDKNKWKEKDRKKKTNEPNVTYYTTLVLLRLGEKCSNQI